MLLLAGVYSSLDSDDNNENDDLGNPLVTQDSGSIYTSTASDAESRLRRRSKSSSFSRAMAEGLTGPNLEGGISQNSLPEDHSDSSCHDNSSGKRSRASKFNYDEIPWGEIFSNPVALTLFLNMFTYGWIGYMVLTELPSYLTDVLGYDLEDAGFLSVVPYVANFFSVMVFGWLFDYVQVLSTLVEFDSCPQLGHCPCRWREGGKSAKCASGPSERPCLAPVASWCSLVS